MRPSFITSLVLVLAIVVPLTAHCENTGAASSAHSDASVRTDIVLRVADLPAADRARLYERNDAIEAALATGLPTWRSFDPNETLSETLAELAKYGVDVGDGALVNFDHIETTMPASRRAEVQALPYVYLVRNPVGMTESCVAGQPCQSAGSAQIGSDVANAAGIAGTGVKVAIIDDGFRNLNNTILAGELPAIPAANTFLVNNNGGPTPNTVINPAPGSNDALSITDFHGEHGTAAAEVVHEVAPNASLYLYGLRSATDGTVTIGQIEKAIRHAADTTGADVILVPMSAVTTIRDPIGIPSGGKNPFTDDIDYATSLGKTVVVSAGNEAFTNFEQTFAPCTDCTDAHRRHLRRGDRTTRATTPSTPRCSATRSTRSRLSRSTNSLMSRTSS